MATSKEKMLYEISQMRAFAAIIIDKASMLEQELSGVVSDSSPKEGLSKITSEKLAKREAKRIKSTH